VRKRVTLRISKGLRAIALAAGISRRVYSDTRVIFITIITIYIVLAEKIGTPLIVLVSDSSVSSVSIHKSIPVDLFLFLVLSRKSHTKKVRVHSIYHSLDCIESKFLVAGHFLFSVSSNPSHKRSSAVFVGSFRLFPVFSHCFILIRSLVSRKKNRKNDRSWSRVQLGSSPIVICLV
jgi:hypothetical protein